MTLANLPRQGVILLAGIFVLLPMALIVYQSGLSGPFFDPEARVSADAYRYVLADREFWQALLNSLLVGAGMVAISVPLGGALAFLMVRTDLPGARLLEPLILAPMLISSIVLALGYVVSIGPVGFYTVWARKAFGFAPWSLYSPYTLLILGGLSHVPHVYLYTSAALKNLGSDIEEVARTMGASPAQVGRHVSLPMIRPALLYSSVLVFFAGVSMFGLALILGNPKGFELITVYLYKLGNRFGVPSYQLMAVVALAIVAMTFPLVMLQRHLLKSGDRYVSIKGKSGRQKLLSLGPWRWVSFAIVAAWLIVTVIVPVSGILLRAFTLRWGQNVDLFEVFTLQQFHRLFENPVFVRAIWNSILIGVVGGAAAVAFYAAVAMATHRRRPDGWSRFIDYVVLVPNAVPGLLIGLAFLWVFLFFPPLVPLRATLVSIWVAYTVVWFAYGIRLISTSLLQIGPELEEAARTAGASRGRAARDVTLPLIRHGLISSWILIFMMFESEYSAGVYLLGSGTEVVGALLVSFADGGAMGTVAALSAVNLALIGVGLVAALKVGARFHD